MTAFAHHIGCVLLVFLATTTIADETSETPVVLPRDVATALDAARRASSPQDALRALDTYHGAPHAWIYLARGNAEMDLADTASDEAVAARRRAGARASYQRALSLDDSLLDAHRGLAQEAVARQDWRTALDHVARAVDPRDADAAAVVFYAGIAIEASDRRLARAVVDDALRRFPNDDRVRQLDLTLALRTERPGAARDAVLDRLDHEPCNAELWSSLAWCEQQLGNDDRHLAALEIAAALSPRDRDMARRLAAVRLASDMPATVLRSVEDRVRGATASELLPPALIELGARAALDCEAPERGKALTDAIPESRRTATLRRLAIRIALMTEAPDDARHHLHALLDAGESDPDVLLWIARVAERLDDTITAEATYSAVAITDSPAARTASLRLAALYLRQGRREEARGIVAAYLDDHPEDVEARRLARELRDASNEPAPTEDR